MGQLIDLDEARARLAREQPADVTERPSHDDAVVYQYPLAGAAPDFFDAA